MGKPRCACYGPRSVPGGGLVANRGSLGAGQEQRRQAFRWVYACPKLNNLGMGYLHMAHCPLRECQMQQNEQERRGCYPVRQNPVACTFVLP
jgi:hypothetical protein